MARQADGTVYINSLMDTSGFKAGGKQMESAARRMAKSVSDIQSKATSGINSIGNSVKKLAGLLAVTFSVKQLTQFGKEAIELGSALSEVQNVVDVTFGDISGEINDFAKNAITQFGLSETAAKQYTSTMGAMLKSMGLTTREAADMSMSMTGLAADMASFYNLDAEDAFYKIRAGISGETEPLKQLGINMSVANLEAYALSKGITKSYNAMTQQEQAVLRYNYLLSVTADAQGDFSRTSESWANQTRVLSEQFKAIKATIGQGLINVFTPVLKVINTLLAKLATLANAFKSFTELITGNKSSGSTGAGAAGLGGGASTSDMAGGYNDAADGAENLAGATEDAADATKKAEKAANGYLSPLDEINKFQTDAEDLSDALNPDTGGAGGTLADAVNDVDYGNVAEGETILDDIGGVLDGLMKKFGELKDLFTAGFWDGLGNYKPALADLMSDIASIKQTLKEIFTDPEVLASIDRFAGRFAYALGQVTGSIASIALTIASLFVGGIEKYLTQNKNRLKRYIISMFDVAGDIVSVIGDIAETFAYIFSVFGSDTAQQIAANIIGIFAEVEMLVSETALKLGRDILNMIAQPIIQNKEKIKEALQGTLEAIEPFTTGLLEAVQAVSDAITRIYDEHLKPFFDSIAQGLSDIFGKLLDGYNTYIVPVLQDLGTKFQELMEGPFGEAIAKIENFIGKLIDALKLLWEEVLVPFFEWIADNIMPVLAPIIQLIGDTALNVLEIIIDAIGNLADILSGVIDFIVGVFTGDWEKAWTGIKEIFGGVWELIKGILSGAWDAIKTIVSGAINVIKTVISAAWNGIKTLTSTIWNAIKTVISTVWKTIKNAVSSALTAVKTKISNVWNNVKETTSNAWQKVKEVVSSKVKEIWNKITGTFSDIWQTMKRVGSNIINGIISGLSEAWNTLISWMQSLWDNIVGRFDNIRDWMANVGKNILYGIADGLSAAWDYITDWASSIFDLFTINIGGGSGGGGETIQVINAFPGTPVYPVPDIPYLAKGAVIPPNAQFMAVLGDQRHGNNLEMPEDLLRKIIREETARNQQKGNSTYRFTAEINRKTLFDQMIDEAVLRQTVYGRNPFELG